jgi:hypothetical protein
MNMSAGSHLTLSPLIVNEWRIVLQCVLKDRLTRLVVISSRSAQDVRQALSMHVAPEIWGGDGLERLCGDGHCERAKLDVPKEALEALAKSEIALRSNGLGNFLAPFITLRHQIDFAGLRIIYSGLSPRNSS